MRAADFLRLLAQPKMGQNQFATYSERLSGRTLRQHSVLHF